MDRSTLIIIAVVAALAVGLGLYAATRRRKPRPLDPSRPVEPVDPDGIDTGKR